jgi:glyoxalase family protein
VEPGDRLAGSHHLPAITAKPQQNPALASGLLGMRPVSKTINLADAGA